MFEIGQRVVCIDDSSSKNSSKMSIPSALKRGAIYTVTRYWVADRRPRIELSEITTPQGFYGWTPTRFAPIKKRDTSIEIFKELLKNKELENT